jgi:hypothetical protein
MRTWLRSRAGGVALSYAAFLALLVRSYTDTRFILVEDFGALGTGFVILWIVGYAALIGGWTWALLRAAVGHGRGAWLALLGFGLLAGFGFGAASLLAFANFRAELVVYGANLVTGVASAVAAWVQLRRT